MVTADAVRVRTGWAGPLVQEKSFKASAGFHFFPLLPLSFPFSWMILCWTLIAVLLRTLVHLLTLLILHLLAWCPLVWISPKCHIPGVTVPHLARACCGVIALPWLLLFYWKRCVFYSSSLVLQTQQVWPGFSSPGWGSRWFHHAWLTCQLLLSEAHPDWFPSPPPALSFYFSTSPLPFWLEPEFGRCKGPGPAKPEAHESVRTDIYLDGNWSNARLRRKRKCRAWKWQKEMSGCWQTAFVRLQTRVKTSTRRPKMGEFQPDHRIFGKSIHAETKKTHGLNVASTP